MPSDAVRADPIPPVPKRTDDLAHARLALMKELEVSVSGSRKALLELDLARIERGTREQLRLLQGIAGTLPCGVVQPGGGHRYAPALELELELELEQEKEKEQEQEKDLRETGERIRQA